MTKVAVCLSGCGVFDGSEIQEAVLVLLALDRAGAEVQCCAPDVAQMHVVNHLTGEVAEGETRNVLVEAARIPRGAVVDVAQVKAADYDAVVFPGGFGAAKNLCDFAVRGADAEAHPEVLRLVRECVAQGTPLGMACIAPAVCATAMKGSGQQVELTVGRGADVSATLDAMGAKAVPHTVEEIHVDAAARVVTTPAYMEDASIAQVARGIDAMVAKVLELAG